MRGIGVLHLFHGKATVPASPSTPLSRNRASVTVSISTLQTAGLNSGAADKCVGWALMVCRQGLRILSSVPRSRLLRRRGEHVSMAVPARAYISRGRECGGIMWLLHCGTAVPDAPPQLLTGSWAPARPCTHAASPKLKAPAGSRGH